MLTEQKIQQVRDYLENQDINSQEKGIQQLCLLKSDLRLSWEDIAELSAQLFGTSWKEGYFRHNYGDLLKIKEVSTDYEDKLLALKKERVKLSDERVQNNAYVRKLAREETLREIAEAYAEQMTSKKFLSIPEVVDEPSKRDAILCISDWHYGIEVDSALNKYSPEICRERVAKLVAKTLKHCQAYGIKHLNVLNLGDLIAGRIHLALRLESRFDVITQIMDVSEILAEMLAELSAKLKVDYYSCIDNHSRLEPNKKDALELETLTRITDWYLKSRLVDNPNISFNKNKFGSDIITFQCKGHNIAAAHGDKDSPTEAATSIARLTRDTYDLICLSHRHHFGADELNETLVIQNSSLMGTDSFAFKLRLSAEPSQNLIIVSENNVTESIHRITLR